MVDLCRRIHSNVQQLRATLQEEAPGKLEELGTSLSELADGERPLPGCGRGQESPKDGSDPHSESTDTEGSVASSDEASKEFVKELCLDKIVQLTNHGKEKYGRVLAEVWVDGRSVGQALVKNGLAHEYEGGTKAGWPAPPGDFSV